MRLFGLHRGLGESLNENSVRGTEQLRFGATFPQKSGAATETSNEVRRLSFRLSRPTSVEFPIAPLLGMAFLFLIFFSFNLKIIASAGDLQTNLPANRTRAMGLARSNVSDIKVRIESDRNGNLTRLMLGSKDLGKNDLAFERLNQEILKMIGHPGNPLTRDIEVEIDADFEARFEYVVKAHEKCAGRYDPGTRQLVRYVEKIRFAPPHKPKA